MKKSKTHLQTKLNNLYLKMGKENLACFITTILPPYNGEEEPPTIEELAKEIYLAIIQFEKDRKAGKLKPESDNFKI